MNLNNFITREHFDVCLFKMATTAWLSHFKIILLPFKSCPHKQTAVTMGKNSFQAIDRSETLSGQWPWNHLPSRKPANPMTPLASVKIFASSPPSHIWSWKIDTPLKSCRKTNHILKSSFAPEETLIRCQCFLIPQVRWWRWCLT